MKTAYIILAMTLCLLATDKAQAADLANVGNGELYSLYVSMDSGTAKLFVRNEIMPRFANSVIFTSNTSGIVTYAGSNFDYEYSMVIDIHCRAGSANQGKIDELMDTYLKRYQNSPLALKIVRRTANVSVALKK